MKLPPRLLDPALRFLIWLSVGRPRPIGLPKPVAKSLNDQRPVVNSLVLHWIQHGRVAPAPGIRRFDGTRSSSWTARARRVRHGRLGDRLPGRAAVPRRRPDPPARPAIPLRVAGCILPAHGPARLYFVGLCAPRGPQLPVYSAQSEVIMDMLDRQERMDQSLVDVFSAADAPEGRIDIVRAHWNEQMERTRRRLRALRTATPDRRPRRPEAPNPCPSRPADDRPGRHHHRRGQGAWPGGRRAIRRPTATGWPWSTRTGTAWPPRPRRSKAVASEVTTIRADIRSREACAAAVASTVERFGTVDVLVELGGRLPASARARHLGGRLAVRLRGQRPRDLLHDGRGHRGHARPGGGRIVNVSSIDGFKAHPANAHYAATKAAVISLTRSVALEVAPLGILVNSVAPGPMATETAKTADWYAPMLAALPTRQPIEPERDRQPHRLPEPPGNVSIAGENIVVSGGGVIV